MVVVMVVEETTATPRTLQDVEPPHMEAVRLTQHRGATLPRGWCLSGAAFDALQDALSAFVASEVL